MDDRKPPKKTDSEPANASESSERLHATLAHARERCRRVSQMCMQVVRRSVRPPEPGTSDEVDLERVRGVVKPEREG